VRADETRAAGNKVHAHRREDTRPVAQPLRRRENKC
jgi:hypothetical protein